MAARRPARHRLPARRQPTTSQRVTASSIDGCADRLRRWWTAVARSAGDAAASSFPARHGTSGTVTRPARRPAASTKVPSMRYAAIRPGDGSGKASSESSQHNAALHRRRYSSSIQKPLQNRQFRMRLMVEHVFGVGASGDTLVGHIRRSSIIFWVASYWEHLSPAIYLLKIPRGRLLLRPSVVRSNRRTEKHCDPTEFGADQRGLIGFWANAAGCITRMTPEAEGRMIPRGCPFCRLALQKMLCTVSGILLAQQTRRDRPSCRQQPDSAVGSWCS